MCQQILQIYRRERERGTEREKEKGEEKILIKQSKKYGKRKEVIDEKITSWIFTEKLGRKKTSLLINL